MIIMFKLRFEVQGRFQFKKYKKDGSEECSAWFDNIVLNQGLNTMAKQEWIQGVAVGTNNTAPVETQVQLGNEVARTTTPQGSTVRDAYSVDATTWVHSARSTFRFPLGAFNNMNLSEVGILAGNSTYTLWNRALIRDLSGNPTTITVLSDEILDVVCEVKVYIKTNDVAGNFNLLNKQGGLIRNVQYTVRPSNINQVHNVGINLSAMNASSFNYAEGFKNASLVAVTSKIGGNALITFRNNLANFSASTYIQDSYKQKFTLTAGANDMNDVAGLSGLFVQGVLASYQVVLDAPIVKNNTQTFSLEYEISWGRYTP